MTRSTVTFKNRFRIIRFPFIFVILIIAIFFGLFLIFISLLDIFTLVYTNIKYDNCGKNSDSCNNNKWQDISFHTSFHLMYFKIVIDLLTLLLFYSKII